MSSTPKKLGFHNRSQYSNFTFGCHDRHRHRRRHNNDIEGSEPDDGLIISELLLKGSLSCDGILNDGQEDEMKITGYRRSALRTLLCWICIILTGGLLRLFMHWWRHWLLLATHSPCPLDIAEKVLVREDYQGKHTLYYVKDVITFNADTLMKMKSEKQKWENFFPLDDNSIINDNEFKVSIHFSNGEFRHADTIRLFRCKQLRYIWDIQTQTFRKLKGLDINIRSTYLHQRKGLSQSEHNARRLVYGANEITIPVKGVFTLLFLEVLNPYYCFQVFSVCLWISYNYYYYAIVIVLMSAFGITMSIIQTKKNQQALRSKVQNSDCAFVIYEDGQTEKVETSHLVPGDVIEIPSSGCTMQCDAVLLSGNCILDESMLTGESVPVTKTPLPMKRDLIFDTKEHSRHTLFCGTKVIQTRYIGSEKVLAVVINTGNITAKGGLIRSILYPPPIDYKFEQDSYKFIALLGLIAGIGFIYTLITKIIRAIPAAKIAIESLDLITIAVPPALPAAMTVGRLNAQKRLERKNIYCISPRSINVSGSIDCVCFDKTGTLTEDGLDMWGVIPKSETNQFQIPLKQIERLPLEHFLFGMVSCHSITIMNGELKGDPLDLKMFESTGWILEEANVADDNKYDLLFPTIVRQPKSNRNSVGSNTSSTKQLDGSDEDLLFGSNDIGIIREFSFTSSLQRMSVITRKLTDNHFNVYCKGSPEMLQTLCRPDTIPENYSNQLDYYAQQGYRIIAVAYKPLDKKMTYAKIQKIGRDKIECDLEFLGFVILENRLKPDTTEVIKQLTTANIRTVMVTGDNILTALSVAKKCGMVTPKQSIITINVRQNLQQPEKYELYYNITGTAGATSSPSNMQTPNGNGEISSILMTNSNSVASLETIATWTYRDVESGLPYDGMNGNGGDGGVIGAGDTNGGGNIDDGTKILQKHDKQLQEFYGNMNNYRFAMIGKTWSIVHEHFPSLLPKFLTRGTIFARMSPEHKQSLILELQNLGYYVAMCGDGANDCGALKAAHTGISLSEAESSVASPFTSKSPTIACVPNVIKEGRAALVTSFGIFKYMAAYSLVQFVSVLILYSIDSNLTDIQFLYIDLGIISVFAFFFGKTEAYDGPLVKQAPLSSLISLSPIVSIVLQLTVAILFQVGGWFHVQSQPWFTPFNYTEKDDSNDYDLACYENYTIFVISCFQYIILAFIFSKGAPYRKSIFSNYMFLIIIIINTVFVMYLTVIPSDLMARKFELIMPPANSNFRYYMLGYGLLNFLISLFIESVIIEYLIFTRMRYRFHNINKSRRKYLLIESELRSNYKWPPLSCYQNDINSIINDKSSPVSYSEIGAEHGIDLNQQLIDQNNSVLNRFFDSTATSNDNKNFDDHQQQPNTQDKSGNIAITNVKKQSPSDTDDDDDGLSNIDSESDYESIQNDLKYYNGSQENVLSSSLSTSNLMKKGTIITMPNDLTIKQSKREQPIQYNNNNNVDFKKNEFILQNNEKIEKTKNDGIEMMLNPLSLMSSSSSTSASVSAPITALNKNHLIAQQENTTNNHHHDTSHHHNHHHHHHHHPLQNDEPFKPYNKQSDFHNDNNSVQQQNHCDDHCEINEDVNRRYIKDNTMNSITINQNDTISNCHNRHHHHRQNQQNNSLPKNTILNHHCDHNDEDVVVVNIDNEFNDDGNNDDCYKIINNFSGTNNSSSSDSNCSNNLNKTNKIELYHRPNNS